MSLPYRDLATRPLFLCFLLAIYKNQRRLPEHPRHMYQRIVQLAIEAWDSKRDVMRLSSYAGFNSEEKIEFLAELSYHITYKRRSQRFSHADLVDAYAKICDRFQLPTAEATKVACELEAHTGIIVDSGFDQFEFSHLSIQEFLCAHYLVRNQSSEKIPEYLNAYPGPVAVAISMASNPNEWFCSLILSDRKLPCNQLSAAVLISRLADERPYFSETESLGLALLRLLSAGQVPENVLARLMNRPNVTGSLIRALKYYKLLEIGIASAQVSLSGTPNTPYYYHAPQIVPLPISIYESLMQQSTT